MDKRNTTTETEVAKAEKEVIQTEAEVAKEVVKMKTEMNISVFYGVRSLVYTVTVKMKNVKIVLIHQKEGMLIQLSRIVKPWSMLLQRPQPLKTREKSCHHLASSRFAEKLCTLTMSLPMIQFTLT